MNILGIDNNLPNELHLCKKCNDKIQKCLMSKKPLKCIKDKTKVNSKSLKYLIVAIAMKKNYQRR
jgi:hypothetical protein